MSKQPSHPIPAWAWLFVVACGIIPVLILSGAIPPDLTLGGAIPATLGGGAAGGCIAAAHNPSRPVGTRKAICVGITAACWGICIGFMVAIAQFLKR
jgi:hypothetical protein